MLSRVSVFLNLQNPCAGSVIANGVARRKKEIMTHDEFEYDVALSFAVQDRGLADKCSELLKSKGISIFLDEYESAERWGNDTIDHLVNIYSRKARYCVLFISQHYPLKTWTEAQRTDARERALRDENEYILPLQLDDTRVPGITQAAGYTDLRQHPMEEVVDRLAQKLEQANAYARSLPQSHDLRSGNISSAKTHSKDVPSDAK
jgi:hypothetical protein